MITVKKINPDNKSEFKTFFKVPFIIYKNNSHWVPYLINKEIEKHIDKTLSLNKFRLNYFIAFNNGKPVARLATGVEDQLNNNLKRKRGFITLFESIEDSKTASILIGNAISNLQKRGMHEVIAIKNVGFDTYGKGLLTKGFNDENKYLLYNPRYYSDLLIESGFTEYKHHDTYWIKLDSFPEEKYKKVIQTAKKRFNFTTRRIFINKNNITAIAEKIVSVIQQTYSSAWDVNQPSAKDIEFELKFIYSLTKNLYIFEALSDERSVGILVAYEDYCNLLYIMNGKYSKISHLKNFIRNKDKNIVHCNMMFAIPEFQNKAVGIALASDALRVGKDNGISIIEASTVNPENIQLEAGIIKLGGIKTRTYTQFIRKI